LSTEPNLGVWKLRATAVVGVSGDGAAASAGDASTELDVRVEEYVLPKYEVSVETAKDWFLVSEPITGHVTAAYSFGRPVRGELRITASRYVGEWQEFATFTTDIDGEADFRLDPAGYVAGVPEAGGQGNVTLEVAVVEPATGYEEKTTQLLTVAAAPVTMKLIGESPSFKPGLPFDLLLVTETPGGEPVEAAVDVQVYYYSENFETVGQDTRRVETKRGTALLDLTPPKGAVRMELNAGSGDAYTYMQSTAAYSPSGNFIHLTQEDAGTLSVGDTARFRVASTSEARTCYYEVVARDRVVFSSSEGASGGGSNEIAFKVTPAMAPGAKLLVYQILPTSEVAADSLPFEVTGVYPHTVSATFDVQEARPGDAVEVAVQTEGPAKVGLVAVDHSVFILAENRLNLQQVFAELERLYMQPQAELHEADPMMGLPLLSPGAKDTFQDAGLIVLSDKDVPEGKEMEDPRGFVGLGGGFMENAADGVLPLRAQSPPTTAASAVGDKTQTSATGGLAEVQRVRQFFPETWIWDEVVTDRNGKATLKVDAPDSITTWDLRAVALSPDKGLGVAESSLRVFQPFFLTADLPYSAIRGEELPLKVSLYNYLDTPQEFQVQIEDSDWFDMLDDATTTVTVAANDIGGAEFTIRPKTLGTQLVKVTARGPQAADAVIKSMLVEPEGVARELVENIVLQTGAEHTIDLRPLVALPLEGGGSAGTGGSSTSTTGSGGSSTGTDVRPGMPFPAWPEVVPDSSRAYVAISGSLLAQTIDGLDQLLQMPFGCGEQNMILFAPDAFILRYLKETRQLKPEIQAKAEMLLVTGYQRELTYQRADGSFSAFGDQDPEGSLFLTAFVLKTFAQAQDLTYIDPQVLSDASAWIESHQKADGSFEPVGFVAHQEMVGGIQGADALTAYATVALLEADRAAPAGSAAAGRSAADKALGYLEGRLHAIDDPYTLALTTYALELGASAKADAAYDKLMKAAIVDDEGLHWSGGGVEPLPGGTGGGIGGGGGDQPVAQPAAQPAGGDQAAMPPIDIYDPSFRPPLDIEATVYATLALIEHGDRLSAGKAAKWLVARRNSAGGFGSTQDTVVALQALTEYAVFGAVDTDLTVTLRAGDVDKQVRITPDNYDVTQVIEVPAGVPVQLRAAGKGEAVVQGVLRYNIREPEPVQSVFDISVDYDADQVAVNDLVDVDVSLAFNPPVLLDTGTEAYPARPVKAGMVVLDVSVPTGFAPEAATLESLLQRPKIKRYDVAGRKVIIYIEDMTAGEKISFSFQVRALYPVRAKGGASQAYSYYTPQWKGETMGEAIVVRGG
ncbi:MAG TPA: alpha-2-macroglobulin family protein, partial [Thermoleophilia bacterium]|nr:alpha-2-macroglobulin family protein [Thermoleophilia bacterium]